MNKNLIPIVLASDNNYAPYLYVTLLSLLENAESSTFYDIFILTPSDFSDINSYRLNRFKSTYSNCKITFIDMKNQFKNVKLKIKHITYPTYYRLLISKLLPQYDKCIYLDVDIIVNGDLNEMFKTNLDNCYIAGVKTPNYHISPEKLQNFRKRLGLPDLKQYVNAGVLILNLKKIRENNLVETFHKLLKKNFPTQDQDILNVACYNYIKHLPLKYNLPSYTFLKYHQKELSIIYEEKELSEAEHKPVIIHYSDKFKPWKYPLSCYAEYWWKYTENGSYKAEIIYNNVLKLHNERENNIKHISKLKLKILTYKFLSNLTFCKEKYINKIIRDKKELEEILTYK